MHLICQRYEEDNNNPYRPPIDSTRTDRNDPVVDYSLWRCLMLARCWQVVPLASLMALIWGDWNLLTWILFFTVFIAIPLLTYHIHRCTRVAITAFTLPLLAFLLMFGIFAFIMLGGGPIR